MHSTMSSLIRRALLIAAACAPAGASRAQSPRLDDAPGFEGMRERWAGVMDEFDVPGLAVAIVRDGRIVALETFGVRAPDAPGAKAAAPTPETMFYIASITKTYLATAICALADDGLLALGDPVVDHLPRFALAGGSVPAADEITIRDLLCHAPGIGEGSPIVMLDAYTGEITEDRYYR